MSKRTLNVIGSSLISLLSNLYSQDTATITTIEEDSQLTQNRIELLENRLKRVEESARITETLTKYGLIESVLNSSGDGGNLYIFLQEHSSTDHTSGKIVTTPSFALSQASITLTLENLIKNHGLEFVSGESVRESNAEPKNDYTNITPEKRDYKTLVEFFSENMSHSYLLAKDWNPQIMLTGFMGKFPEHDRVKELIIERSHNAYSERKIEEKLKLAKSQTDKDRLEEFKARNEEEKKEIFEELIPLFQGFSKYVFDESLKEANNSNQKDLAIIIGGAHGSDFVRYFTEGVPEILNDRVVYIIRPNYSRAFPEISPLLKEETDNR